MFAFLSQVMEERRAILQLEAIPAKPATSMNISKKFLDVLQLSFEVKYMSEDIKLTKERKIKAIKERMEVLFFNVIDDVLTDRNFDDIAALAAAYCNIGSEYVHSTEPDDINAAITILLRCVTLLREKRLNREAILTYIDAANNVSLLFLKEDQEKVTDKFLDTALELYLTYTRGDNYPDPIHIASLVGIKEKESNPRIILNTLHHTTLQYLGRQYLTRPEDKHRFVMYLYEILNTRLSDMVSGKTKFDEKCLDMALTLFDLSRYFLANGRFAEAKSHIAIADSVIRRFAEETKDKTVGFFLSEKYAFARAITDQSWGSYGVFLLRFWMEKFSQNKENKSSEIQDLTPKLEIKSEQPNLMSSDLEKELASKSSEIQDLTSNLEIKSEQPNLMSSDLEKELENKSSEIQDLTSKLEIKSEQPNLMSFDLEKELENKSSEIQDLTSKLEIKSEQSNLMFSDLEKELECTTIAITETCILNLADAKSVFSNTLKQLQIAKEHFTPDTDIVGYALITLEVSDAYKYYAGFEEQRDNRIKLHKLRVKHLEDARKKFRTTEDDRELQIYKRISYEVVTSCSTVMDLMVEETYYNKSFKELSTKADEYMKIIAENVNFYLNVA